MKKILSNILVLLLLVLPVSFADPSSPSPDASCGIFNFMQCLRDTAYLLSYSTGLAAQPLITFVKNLMIEQPTTSIFNTVWLGITGILNIFYIFFLLYSGIVFITASDNLARRYQAKESIKNMILAIIFVTSSFFVYNIFIDLNSSLTSYVFAQINPAFFTVTSTSVVNAILQLLLIIVYILVLFLTCILFVARWLMVSFGIIFMPLGVFMYFVPFLQNYGKLIINMFLLLIFIPFISALVLLGSSMLATAPVLQNFSILFYIVAFCIVDFIFYSLIKFVIKKSALGDAFSAVKTAVAIGAKFI